MKKLSSVLVLSILLAMLLHGCGKVETQTIYYEGNKEKVIKIVIASKETEEIVNFINKLLVGKKSTLKYSNFDITKADYAVELTPYHRSDKKGNSLVFYLFVTGDRLTYITNGDDNVFHPGEVTTSDATLEEFKAFVYEDKIIGN